MGSKDEKTVSRSVNLAATIAAVFGVLWILYVVFAFALADPIPIYKHNNHIGNINIVTYNAHNNNGHMEGEINAHFHPVNNDIGSIDNLNLDWVQVVRNEHYHPNGPDGQPLDPPYVDPPNGGYQGAPDDNKPPYWDENERRNHIDNNINTFEIEDYPGTWGNFLSFETFLVEIEGNNIEVLGGFNWGMNRTPSGVERWPTTPGLYNHNYYPNDLNNIISDDFPGWRVVTWTPPEGIPTIPPLLLLVLAVAILGFGVWILSNR